MDRGALAARLRRDEGFGLVEAVVALVIIFGLILVLMRTFDSSVRVLVETRRASAANQFATELIERAQALEWQHMGLAASTNGSDCGTRQVGCSIHLTEFPELASDGAGGWELDGEAVIFTSSDTFKPFLDFHERVERDGTEFDRYIFVTSVDDDADGLEDFRRLSAVVRWTPPSGFQRSVEQSTLVTPFSRPRQPLIRTDVTYSGGSVDITGLSRTGAVAESSQWAGSVAQERESFTAGVSLPGLEVSALSDYVSEGRVRLEGASVPLLSWSGADDVMGTTDDRPGSVDPFELSLLADDDPLSSPSPDVATTTVSAPGLLVTDPYPDDLFIAQLQDAAALDSGLVADGSMVGRVTTADAAGAADDLPHAQASLVGSDKTVVGFLEYGDSGSRTFYATEWGGATFPLSSFGFSLYRQQDRSGSQVLEVDAVADRVDTDGDQTTVGDLSFRSPATELLRDDVIDQAVGGGFRGWVVVEPPTVRVSDIGAGQGYLPLADPVNAGTLRIEVWDPAAEAYVTTTVDYDDHGGDCSAVPAPIVVPVGAAGAPLTAEVLTSPLPWLTYEVQGTITINPWCVETVYDATDPTVVTDSSWETVGPMVVANLSYRVLDNGPLFDDPGATPIELFDLTLDIATDAMSITSVYVDPT